MRRVQPSTIIDYIDGAFPEVVRKSGAVTTPYDRVAELKVLLRFVDDLDAAFLPAEKEPLVKLLVASEKIRNHVQGWDTHGSGYGGNLRGDSDRQNSVFVIREVLRFHCREMAVPEATAGLEFIDDPEYRQRLREDVASAESSFEDGQFKASTVLAGGVIEALILFELQGRSEDIQDPTLGPKRLDERTLGELLKIARSLNLFSDEALRAAELAKDFRNLIHPGRELRKAATCTRGTARSALAAMDLLINECTTRRRQ